MARVTAVASACVASAARDDNTVTSPSSLIGDETLCDGLSEVWRASAWFDLSLLAMVEGGRGLVCACALVLPLPCCC